MGKIHRKKILEKICKAKIIIILFLLLMGILIYGLFHIYGPIAYPDEIGYWANAARIAGYDWSQIASLNSYYSYGYSFFLIPFMILSGDAIFIYRLAIVSNGILLCFTFYILYHILIRILDGMDKNIILFLAGIAVFYPGFLFYMQMTLTEILLVLLFVLFCFELIIYLEKPKYLYVFFMALTLIYIYVVHMRAIAIVSAACAVFFLLMVARKEYRKSGILFILVILGLFLLACTGKKMIVQDVYRYAAGSTISVNDYAGQVGAIRSLFSLEGIAQLAVSIIGKLFYLTAATFGMFIWGFIDILQKIRDGLRSQPKDKSQKAKTGFYVFLLLAGIGSIAVTSIYTMYGRRMDMLIYGRYSEYILPIYLCLGIAKLLRTKCMVKGTFVLAVVQGMAALFLYYIYQTNDYSGMHECFIPGTAYAWYLSGHSPQRMIGIIWICSTCFMILLMVTILLLRKDQKKINLLLIILVLQIGIAMPVNEGFVYWNNEFNQEDQVVINKIKDMTKNSEEARRILFVNSEGLSNIGLLQLSLREQKIEVIEEDELKTLLVQSKGLRRTDIIVTYPNNREGGNLQQNYKVVTDTEDFVVYANEE